jgi:hypothetical protein
VRFLLRQPSVPQELLERERVDMGAQIHWGNASVECSEIHEILGCFSDQQILALRPRSCDRDSRCTPRQAVALAGFHVRQISPPAERADYGKAVERE